MTQPTYVLLSSARDEQEHIGNTIASVARQTIVPLKWIIVDDGSKDATPEIVRQLATKHPWLQLVMRERPKDRSFQSQYAAIMEAYSHLKEPDCQFVSKADTDLIFEDPAYFETLFKEMSRNPRLGLTGGWILDTDGHTFASRPTNRIHSVAGGLQTFRRRCFEQIGGYHALRYGGSDTLAEIMARQAGWNVYALPTLRVLHCRPTGGFDGALRSAWRWGKRDASFGSLFAFCLLKYAGRLHHQPILLGSLVSFAACLWFHIRRESIAIPPDSSRYLRREQWGRVLRSLGISSITRGMEEASARPEMPPSR